MFTYRSEDFPPLIYKVQSKEGLKEKPYKLAYQAAAFAQEKILQGLIREFSEDLTFLQESILDNPINNSGKFDSVKICTSGGKQKKIISQQISFLPIPEKIKYQKSKQNQDDLKAEFK